MNESILIIAPTLERMSSYRKPKFVEKKETDDDRDSFQENRSKQRDDRYDDRNSDPYIMDER
jgi:hypothetical protein